MAILQRMVSVGSGCEGGRPYGMVLDGSPEEEASTVSYWPTGPGAQGEAR